MENTSTPTNSPKPGRSANSTISKQKGLKTSLNLKKTIAVVNDTEYKIFLVVGADPNTKRLEEINVGVGQTKAQLGLKFIHCNSAKDQFICVKPKGETTINIDGSQAYVSAECQTAFCRCLLFGDRLVKAGQLVTITEEHIENPFKWEYSLF